MLNFDSKGNLKPYKPILCGVKDLKEHLVDNIESTTRKDNYDKYIKYSSDLKALTGCEIKQWINGSFVTQKINPKDIDLISFLDHETIKKLGTKLDPFKPKISWTTYGVDAYILEVYPPNHQFLNFTTSDIAQWTEWFGQTRVTRNGIKNKKGFLEIIY
jgi:hypothetical protein